MPRGPGKGEQPFKLGCISVDMMAPVLPLWCQPAPVPPLKTGNGAGVPQRGTFLSLNLVLSWKDAGSPWRPPASVDIQQGMK